MLCDLWNVRKGEKKCRLFKHGYISKVILLKVFSFNEVMLSFPRDELVGDITGICQIADLHGTNDEKPHIRILYVDATGSDSTTKTR
jgi:hypothetical protein